jgi:hypothetical protein
LVSNNCDSLVHVIADKFKFLGVNNRGLLVNISDVTCFVIICLRVVPFWGCGLG